MALLAGSQDFEFTIAPNQQHCELGAMVNIGKNRYLYNNMFILKVNIFTLFFLYGTIATLLTTNYYTLTTNL